MQSCSVFNRHLSLRFAVRLDTHHAPHRELGRLLLRAEHFSGPHLVSGAGVHDHLQRHHGLHVWLLLRQNPVDQTVPQKDLGRIYRRRFLHRRVWHPSKHKPGSLFSSIFLCLPLSLFFQTLDVPCDDSIPVLHLPGGIQRRRRTTLHGLHTLLPLPAAAVHAP